MPDSTIFESNSALYNDIVSGRKLYPLSYDAAFKKLFHPDHHPDRLNLLLRGITGDSSIEIAGSASNEGMILTKDSKKVIFDLPSELRDQRRLITELQKAPQSFITNRADIYSANMLTNQFSAEYSSAKGAIRYRDIRGVILVVLMVKTPSNFARIPSPEGSQFHPYIQRLTYNITNEGVVHDRLQKIYYAELDECLKQYEAGVDLCGNLELQFILSAICDANSTKVAREFVDGKHADIYNELKQMAFDKEAMEMLFSEELAHTDWVTMEKEIQELKNNNSDKDQLIANKNQQIAEKEDQIAVLMNDNSDKDQQIADKDSRISILMNDNFNKDQQITEKDQQLADKDNQLSALKEELERIKASINP